MASSPFCSFLKAVQSAQPALTPKATPVLHAFAQLAAAFQPAPPLPAVPDKGPAKVTVTCCRHLKVGPFESHKCLDLHHKACAVFCSVALSSDQEE